MPACKRVYERTHAQRDAADAADNYVTVTFHLLVCSARTLKIRATRARAGRRRCCFGFMCLCVYVCVCEEMYAPQCAQDIKWPKKNNV